MKYKTRAKVKFLSRIENKNVIKAPKSKLGK